MHYPALWTLLKSNPEVPKHFRKFFNNKKLPLTAARVEKNAQDLVISVESGLGRGEGGSNLYMQDDIFYTTTVKRNNQIYYHWKIMERRNLNLLSDSFLYKQIKIKSQQSPAYNSHREHEPTFGKCCWNKAEADLEISQTDDKQLHCSGFCLLKLIANYRNQYFIKKYGQQIIESSVMSWK